MQRKEKLLVEYKRYRDKSLSQGNLPWAAFFQTLILDGVEKSPFSFQKKREMEQHRHILYDLLENILECEDEWYFKGVCYEVILATSTRRLTGCEEDCRKCNLCFDESDIVAYVRGAYTLHISNIQLLVGYDPETAHRYADNLLKLLELRYGIQSVEYAKMKWHIWNECFRTIYKEECEQLIQRGYEYYKKYLADSDAYFCEALIQYTYSLSEKTDGEYKMWLRRCEDLAEKNREDRIYNLLKCKIAWVQAYVCRVQGRHSMAIELLQNAIAQYLSIDTYKHLFYGYVYLDAAYNSYCLQKYTEMYDYAQAGLEICSESGENGSELYFGLYIYKGIKLMVEHNLSEAEILLNSCLEDIEMKYGKDCETYKKYMCNLGVIALRQGKRTDIYVQENLTEDKAIKKQYNETLCNELLWVIADGASWREIKQTYDNCVKEMQGEELGKTRERLDTIYLSARIHEHLFNEETEILIKKLEKSYNELFVDGLGTIYWISRALYVWHRGELENALKIFEKIVERMRQEEYMQYREAVIEYTAFDMGRSV